MKPSSPSDQHARDATPAEMRLPVFDAVVEHMHAALLLETAERRIFAVNTRFCRMFGIPAAPAALIGQDCSLAAEQVKHLLGDSEEFPHRIEVLLREGRPAFGEEIRFADGTVAERDYVPVHDGRGTLLGHLWLYRDVTERNKVEAELRRSEERYRGLFNHAVHGVYRSDREGRFVTVNPALVGMLGYDSAEELLRLDIATQVYADPGERSRLIERYGNSEAFKNVMATWRRKDGSPLRVQLSGRVTRDRSGAISGFETIVVDVTEQAVLEDRLREAQKMEALGQFTGGIAHDFNNILSVILGNIQLLEGALGPTQPEVMEEVREVRAAAERAATLTKRLLGFSRRAELRPRPTDLAAVVRGMATMLRRIVPEHIVMNIAATERVPAVLVDASAIEQILLNVVANARDAMPQGGELRVQVRAMERVGEGLDQRPEMPAGPYIRMTVADTGRGMDADVLARIFEPFFTTKQRGEGTGMGMAMVYGLIKQQGGFVYVESEPGHGTVVQLYFPAIEAAAVALPRRVSGQQVRGGTETILLVEDDPAVRRAGQRVLERHGYRLLVAADGQEALRVYREHMGAIDLIICDVIMPRVAGSQVYEEIRRLAPDQRFIITSGYGDTFSRNLSLPFTSAPFIPKPWDITELLIRVREVLDQN